MQQHRGNAISDSAYSPISKLLQVELPARHVPPEVHEAAERFSRACAAVRAAEAEIDKAQRAVRDTENRVIHEAYVAVHEDAEIDEDAKLAQSEDWASSKAAEETALARLRGTQQAAAAMHDDLVRVAGNPEWGAYLEAQREVLSQRLATGLTEAIDVLEELLEIEGLKVLVANGGLIEKRTHRSVMPSEGYEAQQVRELQDKLRTILAPEVKAQRKLSAQQKWIRSDASDKAFAPVKHEES